MRTKLRRILIWITAFTISLLLSMPVFAEGEFTVSLVPEKESYMPGETAKVYVHLENNPLIDSCKLYMAFDYTVFLSPEVEKGELYSNDTGLVPRWSDFEYEEGKIVKNVYAKSSMKTSKESGDLLVLSFQIAETAKEGEYSMELHPDFIEGFQAGAILRTEFKRTVTENKTSKTTIYWIDGENKFIFVPCTIKIQKETPVFTAPKELKAVCGNTLSDLTEQLPAGYQWNESEKTEQPLSAGTVEVKLDFNSDPIKYNTVTGLAQIQVAHIAEREIKNTQEATAQTEGYTGDTCCKGCGEVVNKGTVIPKKETEKQPETEKKPETDKQPETTPAPTTVAPGTVASDTASNGKYKVLADGQSVIYAAPIAKKAKVVIPDTVVVNGVTCKVTEIAPSAFKGNKKITSVTIGANIAKIGKSAFKNCKKLKTIKIRSTLLTKKGIGAKAFTGTAAKVKVTVPAKSFKSYQKLLKSKGMSKKAVYKKGK